MTDETRFKPAPGKTIAEVLEWRARHEGGNDAYVFVAGGDEQSRVTYHDLDSRARIIAAALAERELFGECALLAYPSGIDFLSAFYGCLYAGVAATPVGLPAGLRGHRRPAYEFPARNLIVGHQFPL